MATDDNDHADWFECGRKREISGGTYPGTFGINLESGLRTWTKPRCTRSGPEVRFINPAIYAESCCGDANDGKVRDSTAGIEELSALSIKNEVVTTSLVEGCSGEGTSSQDTYRCSSSNSRMTISPSEPEVLAVRSRLTLTQRDTMRVERRCRIGMMMPISDVASYAERSGQSGVQRYTTNDDRMVEMSVSLSSSNVSAHQAGTLARKIAHDEWLRRKRMHAERKKIEEDRENERKRMDDERLEREKRDKRQREQESFLRWSERKRKEEADRKAAMSKELELQERLKEIGEKAAVAKALCLRQWVRKKDEEKKEHERKEQLKQKISEEGKMKRLEENSKAFEKWRETAKNRPKPATQGLLPYQKAKPGYINPRPWQGLMGEDAEKEENVLTIGRRSRSDQSWRNDRK